VFVTRRSLFVTQCPGATTHCHHNFGYSFANRLIPDAEMSYQFGPRYARESKLVYR